METYIVSYDIASNYRWRKVHETLLDFGRPLQLSVFVCHLSKRQFVILKNRISAVISQHDDRVLFCPICPRCLKGLKTVGLQEPVEVPSGPIVV